MLQFIPLKSANLFKPIIHSHIIIFSVLYDTDACLIQVDYSESAIVRYEGLVL